MVPKDMNRRTFLKWLGASGVVAATTDPLELLEGAKVEPVTEDNIASVRSKYVPFQGYGHFIELTANTSIAMGDVVALSPNGQEASKANADNKEKYVGIAVSGAFPGEIVQIRLT